VLDRFDLLACLQLGQKDHYSSRTAFSSRSSFASMRMSLAQPVFHDQTTCQQDDEQEQNEYNN
jgi:hypothetical protein